MKVIIVGGGISGLYSALKLLDLGFMNIEIYEAKDRLGGNIYTHYDKDIQLEAGGARFNKYHHTLLKLLKRFNLTTIPNPNKKVYKSVLCTDSKTINDPSYNYIKKVIEFSDKLSKEDLLQLTFGQLCDMVLGPKKGKLLVQSFGYNAEFLVANAYASIEIFKEDFNLDTEYYNCKEGLSELVKRMSDYLINNGVKIHTNKILINFSYKTKFKLYFEDQTILCDYLVLALPKNQLIKFNYFNSYQKDLFNSVTSISLHRIYAQYNSINNKVWFEKTKRTTTDINIRQFIPIDYTKGIAMISYSDLMDADYWKTFADQGIEKLQHQLTTQLKLLFNNYHEDTLKWILSFYWKEGVHSWNVGADPKFIQSEIKRIHPKLFIVGESFSKRQGWIEGALNTVDDMITFKKGGEGLYVKLKVPGEKIIRKIDVTEWINLHPGGSAPYTQNMYKDITSKFMNIHSHFTDFDKKIIKPYVLEKINKYTIS